MEHRANRNVLGYVDWTTGLLLSDTSDVYPQQQQQSQENHPPQQGILQPVVHLQATSSFNYTTPSYTIASAEISNFPSNSSSYCHPELSISSSAASGFLSAATEPCSSNQSTGISSHHPRYTFAQTASASLPQTSFAIPGPSRCSGITGTGFAVSKEPKSSSRHHPASAFSSSSDDMAGTGRGARSKERSKKRSTSVVADSGEDQDGSHRSYKMQKSVSSSYGDFDDLQSRCTRDGSDDDDETQEDSRMSPSSSPTPSDEPRKGGRQNHSEIEKRRRDKMNTYITELSRVVPMCITMSHKLDKLTVLRMAVQHLKTIRGAIHSYTEGDYKPAFLSDEELKRLILQSADGFLFVVGCDRGRILYVSETVSQILNFSQGDLLGQSWFDILHPKDVAKVKEQLSSSDLSPRERLIDAKTMLPVKTDVPQGLSRLCPGARRSFFCRMKCKAVSQTVKEEADATGSSAGFKHRKSQSISKEKRYVVVHCTGYLKSWAPTKIGMQDQDAEGDVEACNLSCLVAVGRIQPSILPAQGTSQGSASTSSQGSGPGRSPQSPPIEFNSRHAIDGKFIFVDQRVTLLLGILPQEMLGTSMYEYYHVDDIAALTESHKAALQSTETLTTAVYRFRVKEGSYVRLQSRWKSFRNPWTKEIECLVAKNAYIPSENTDSYNLTVDLTGNYDIFHPGTPMSSVSNNAPARVRLFSMELEASKIGQTVADEVLDSQRRSCSSASLSSSIGPSPGSMISGSTTASPFSNVGSPLDPDGSYLVAGVLASSFSSEEVRRNVMVNNGAGPSSGSSGGSPSVSVGSTGGSTMTSVTSASEISRRSASGVTSQANSSNNALTGARSNHNNNHSASNHVKVRDITQLQHILNEAGLHADEGMIEVIGGLMMDQSQSPSREASSHGDGNDEAAMAVVMSLLEADAGLGGPVDFSGLPWPLP